MFVLCGALWLLTVWLVAAHCEAWGCYGTCGCSLWGLWLFTVRLVAARCRACDCSLWGLFSYFVLYVVVSCCILLVLPCILAVSLGKIDLVTLLFVGLQLAYRIYLKHSNTSTPHHSCSKIWRSTIYYPMLCLKIAGWVENSVVCGASSGSTLFAQACVRIHTVNTVLSVLVSFRFLLMSLVGYVLWLWFFLDSFTTILPAQQNYSEKHSSFNKPRKNGFQEYIL